MTHPSNLLVAPPPRCGLQPLTGLPRDFNNKIPPRRLRFRLLHDKLIRFSILLSKPTFPMKPEIMTLKEAAEYIRLNEKTVSRLAQKGEIPALKVSRQWRFDRAAIDAWMAGRNSTPVTAQQLSTEATGLPQPLTVADVMSPSRIQLNLQASARDDVLHELVALVIDPEEGHHADTLFKALKVREDLCSTCVDEGVAIPHARNALVGLVDQPVIAYGRHRAGVDFGALDGKPVHHFFLLCAPNVREHLQLLARLARLVKNIDFRAKLAAAQQPEQVIELIRDAERGFPN
jgi:PTS system nitrogen regulatory IIA component